MTSGRLHDAVVIGAGMAGLTAARTLVDAGLDVVVVDKSRAVGGRMATRRFAGARFDHGAQHFSARSTEFRDAVGEWRRRGLVRVWYEAQSITQPERGIEPRHVGAGAMRALPEHLADPLTVHTDWSVDCIGLDGRIAIVSAGDRSLHGRSVLLTPPLPQSLGLLAESAIRLAPSDAARLAAVEYDATLAVLATLDRSPGLSAGHAAFGDGPIAWIADNQHKGVSPVPAVTIHSSPEFAATYLDHDPAMWTASLVAAAETSLGAGAVVARGHRWRYSQPRTTFDVGAVVAESQVPVVLAGEVFAGAKVEGAFLSGKTAAERILARLA